MRASGGMPSVVWKEFSGGVYAQRVNVAAQRRQIVIGLFVEVLVPCVSCVDEKKKIN
jgi:hypothetical protein